jgi:hypothetical protein
VTQVDFHRGDQSIRIGLEDVRSANSIDIQFDFNRNGWSIKMPSVLSFSADDTVMDEKLIEQAFIPAWAVGDDDDESA